MPGTFAREITPAEDDAGPRQRLGQLGLFAAARLHDVVDLELTLVQHKINRVIADKALACLPFVESVLQLGTIFCIKACCACIALQWNSIGVW